MNIKNFFNKKIDIVDSFIVEDGIFANHTVLFVLDSTGRKSLYSYPDLRFLVGNLELSKGYLRDHIPTVKYDNRVDRKMYDECRHFNDYNELLQEFHSSYWLSDTLDLNFSNLYSDGNNQNALDLLNKNIKIFKYICDKYEIVYESNPEVIMKEIIEKLNLFPEDPMVRSINIPRIDISFCSSEKEISSYFTSKLELCKNKEDFKKLSESMAGMMGASQRLIFGYSGELFHKDDFIKDVVVNKDFKNNKELIKNYMEFFIVFPYFCSIIRKLESCSKMAQKVYDQKKIDDFHSNEKFIDDLNQIVSHDNSMDLGFHACIDGETAINIMKEGLYMFSSDIESTMYFNFNTNQALFYEYGNGITMCGDYIVVIAVPHGENISRKLTSEEQENVNISARRISIASKPEYVVDSNYIVGFIDKKHQKVIFNPKFRLPDRKEEDDYGR